MRNTRNYIKNRKKYTTNAIINPSRRNPFKKLILGLGLRLSFILDLRLEGLRISFGGFSLGLFFFLFSFFSLCLNHTFSQEEEFTDPLDSYRGESRYFKTFQESFYQEDRFLEELEDQDSERTYYRVFFNDRQQPDTVGYYSTQIDKEDGSKVTRLSQHVNSKREAYYVIKYQYSEIVPDRVRIKYFKDFYGRVISYFLYTWDEKSKRLIRLEHYAKTPFLNQMELQYSHELTWKGEALSTMTFYDKSGKKIERYTLQPSIGTTNDSNDANDGIQGNLQSSVPNLFVGNNRIFIGYLQRYERFQRGLAAFENGKEKPLYLILYSPLEGGFLEEKYNADGVLFEEKFHPSISSQDE